IQLAANQTRLFIDGLEIRDPGSHGIHINDGSFAEIRNAAISGTGLHGIIIEDDNTVTIVDTSISDTEEDGIRFSDDNIVWIGGVTIADAFHGIHLSSRNVADIIDTVILDANEDAIHAGAENTRITIRGGRIERAIDNGLQIGSDQADLTIADLVIIDSGGHGMQIDSDTVVNISNVQVLGTALHGLYFEGSDTTVTLADVTIEDTGEDGVHIEDDGNSVTMTNVAIARTGEHGVHIRSEDNTVRITGGSFTDIGLDGDTEYDGVHVTEFNFVAITDTVFDTIDGNAIYVEPQIDPTLETILQASGNTFRGTIGGHAFAFTGSGGTVLAGSDGNVDETNGASLCNTSAADSFTGTIRFTSGVTLKSDELPCHVD
ncbi:MAG: right-handed parallel beta-helix repeat-containing protein, partial [Hyphomicrobiaceae bacterium]